MPEELLIRYADGKQEEYEEAARLRQDDGFLMLVAAEVENAFFLALIGGREAQAAS